MADRIAQTATNLVEYTVSELAFALRRTVEDNFGLVKLRGEISGFKGRHASGHCYFTLKDEHACIEAVIWKSTFQRLKFKPEQGLEVIARGRVTTYPDKSKYQIVIDELEPAGVGALMALLEQRKKMLAAEGLFHEQRKKKLPYLPRIVGVVTSPTGAVIRDILHRLADRCPCHVLVWPVRVQGETCAAEVAGAIAGFNALMIGAAVPRPDLIIVARGGGSLEDLWGFNEEIVARAVAASAIPLISAVGHETDWTIIDLVADWRAPTPTAAAERAVPVRAELLVTVRNFGMRAISNLRRALEARRSRFLAAARGLPRRAEILELPRQRLDSASGRLPRVLLASARAHRGALERCAARLRPHIVARAATSGRERLIRLDRSRERAASAMIERARRKLDEQAKLLGTLAYHNVLTRGFTLVRDASGAMLRRASEVKPGAALDIEFADGHIGAHADPRGRKPEAQTKEPRKPADGKQGTLL
ncbi:MAG TPA: exodeoxyribonuclease VII large subunit [Methyloceanibacter sp.]|jgi:exodeoxyribonuclease VII large subunit|nr:exodeoxyribonuclease VII large subunit [Methyloceanibacter sp.]